MPPEFDMQKARDACENLPKYMVGACPSKEEARAAGMLPAALDEIERLQDALAEERAATIAYENNMQLCECREYALCQAREQLRQEGKL